MKEYLHSSLTGSFNGVVVDSRAARARARALPQEVERAAITGPCRTLTETGQRKSNETGIELLLL